MAAARPGYVCIVSATQQCPPSLFKHDFQSPWGRYLVSGLSPMGEASIPWFPALGFRRGMTWRRSAFAGGQNPQESALRQDAWRNGVLA